MRTVQLYYPLLSQKKVGNRVGFVEPDVIKHLKILRTSQNNYNFVIADGLGRKAKVDLVSFSGHDGGLFEIVEIEDYSEQTQKLQNLETSAMISDSKPNLQRKLPVHHNWQLLLPVIRQSNLEQAVNMASQMNLYSRILLVDTKYSQINVNQLSDRKIDRMSKKALAGFTQSQSWLLPEIKLATPVNLSDYISIHADRELMFIPDNRDSKKLSESMKLKNIEREHLTKLSLTKSVIVGPEGGWENSEQNLFSSTADLVRFCIGNSIFTTEAAVPIVSGAILTYL